MDLFLCPEPMYGALIETDIAPEHPVVHNGALEHTLDASLSAVTMVWQYIGQLIFNMLILTGLVKGADRIVKEMFGL